MTTHINSINPASYGSLPGSLYNPPIPKSLDPLGDRPSQKVTVQPLGSTKFKETVNRCTKILQAYRQSETGRLPQDTRILQGVEYNTQMSLLLKLADSIRERLVKKSVERSSPMYAQKREAIQLIESIRKEINNKTITLMEFDGHRSG